MTKLRGGEPTTRKSWAEGLEEEFQANTSLPLWREALLGIDWISLRMSPVFRGRGIPKGNGAGVVVVPGFMGSDQYLGDMNSWLRRIGYTPFLSGIGRNADCPDVLTRRLHETILYARNETGRPVHLIGHSLGGVISRSAAARWPEDVASVATMASPFRGVRVHPFVLQTAHLVRGRILQRQGAAEEKKPHCYSGYCTCEFLTSLRNMFPEEVPQIAIFTKTDGVVDWRYCVNEFEDGTDIEVPGTHVGLAFNPQVYKHIANFLAEPESYRVTDAA
ncbi:MAG TPA: alpha/beta fold hydrolase [Dehalococcoidia bacterium]|nr:alpha/beta fold hydrolase [Dehalococcoidia bacterium]